jgi:hypothetical protein
MKQSEGQSLVEFALLLPIVMLLMLGILEVGRAIAITIKVTNGATAGAVFASQNPTTAENIAGIQRTVLCDINNATFSGVNGFLFPNCNYTSDQVTITSSYGCVCDQGGATSCTNPISGVGNCSTVSCPGGQIAECVQVTTQETFAPLFSYPGLPNSYQANGNAVMRVRK